MAKTKRAAADSADFPLAPRPRTGILTGILCVLNILAAGAFLYIMMLDLEKRREWTTASFQLDLHIKGVPFKEAGKKFMGVDETTPRPILNADELAASFKNRNTGGGTVKGQFISRKEFPPPRIDPDNLDPASLGKAFGNLSSPVASLEEEVNRVGNAILRDINTAAAAAAKNEKSAEDKREKLEKLLLPQAVDSFQVLELDKFVRNLDDGKLEELLIVAYERRMLLDILKPVEFFRPGDPKLPYLHLEEVRDVKDLKLKELQDKLMLRLRNAVEDTYDSRISVVKGKRPATEKHENIAFLLFAIAHTLGPDQKPLYENGAVRTQTVVGLYAFADAAREYKKAVASIYDQLVQRIRLDREGAVVQLDKDKMDRTRAFTARYVDMIRTIRDQITAIDKAESTLKDKETQRDRAEKTYFEGVEDVRAREKELRVERAKTAKLLVDLQAIQARLFRSQLELATAASVNEDLHRQVVEAERELARIQGILPAKGKAP